MEFSLTLSIGKLFLKKMFKDEDEVKTVYWRAGKTDGEKKYNRFLVDDFQDLRWNVWLPMMVAVATVIVFVHICNVTRCTFPLFLLLATVKWCHLRRFYFLNNRPNQNLHRRAYRHLEDFEYQLYNVKCLYCERIKLTIDKQSLSIQ